MRKGILATLAIGTLVWAAAVWPVPLHFSSAVPCAERRAPGEPAVTCMEPGDHIQLLYHFWLCRDMIAGKTPAFSNVYEFNTSGDAAAFRFDTYYVPFSLVYALVSPLFGHAAGWNAAGLFSHLLGLLGFFALARRLAKSDLAATAVAVAASAFPYRWIALVNGSPTGFAFCFVPWLFHGVDRAARDASPGGGLVAGLALFLSYCSDLHVFYFSALAAPFAFAAFLLLGRASHPQPLRKIALAALPIAFLGLAAVLLSKFSAANLGKSTMAGGRTLREIRLFSPIASGLFRRQRLAGAANHIFVGVSLAAALLLGYARLLSSAPLRREWRRWAFVALLSAAALAVFLLALGAHGPLDALPLRAARKLVPRYTMIRQPAKIFCLLPAILAACAAVLFAPGGEAAAPPARRRRPQAAFAAAGLALAACVAVEQTGWLRVKACRLPAEMPAYEAVAKAAGETAPKAVCVTLWPGDSHWSSVYEYGVMHSRLRLLNGYSPSVPGDYFEKVFAPLASLNEGRVDDAQFRHLADLGVGYLLFHESPYPGNVSPFPAGVALAELAANPRLAPLAHERGVAAFRILGAADAAPPRPAEPRPYLDYPASFHWDARKVARSLETAGKGEINLRFRAPVVLHEGMRYLLLDARTGWREIPIDDPMGSVAKLPEGVSDVRHVLVSAGTYPVDFLEPVRLVPARMFHKGTGDAATGRVAFCADATPLGPALRGPALPIPRGRYRLSVATKGGAASRSVLHVGTVGEAPESHHESMPFSRGDGDAVTMEFDHATDAPFSLEINYGGQADLEVTSILLERLPKPPGGGEAARQER